MFTPKNDKQYKNNCASCKYLGTIKEKGVLVDLYIHPAKNKSMDTFLARYGGTGSDYTSAVRTIVEQPSYATHACRQAWRIEQDRLDVEVENPNSAYTT